MKKALLATVIILALAAATPMAFAKGKPTVELGNNLSFATKFVGTFGAPPTRVTPCNEFVPTLPYGPQCNLFPGYWCQKTEAVWQAVCELVDPIADPPVFVTAMWGANLLGDAPLKAGRPIRVEMVLTESAGPTANGYIVTNLTPELEDRSSTYGTNGTEASGSYVVFDSGAKLKIEMCADEACEPPTVPILPEAVATAELNSLGKVVYGYNWGTSGKATAAQPGIYKVTFTANHTTIIDAPGGAQRCAPVDNCTYVIITVTQSSGGGGGGPPNRP